MSFSLQNYTCVIWCEVTRFSALTCVWKLTEASIVRV